MSEAAKMEREDDELKSLSREVIELLRKQQDGGEKKRKREKKAEAKEVAAKDGSKMAGHKRDKQGNTYLELTNTRRVTLSKFKGKARVDIREFYAGDKGELMPGKKGISLSLEEFQKFKQLMP